MSLCQLLFARGRYKHEYFLLCIVAVLLSLIFHIETVHSFLHSLLKFYSKRKFVWFCYLVVFISTLWAKAGPHRASIDSSEKRIMLDNQLTVLLGKVVLSLKIPSHMRRRPTREDTRGAP